jgi:hypothetical protein
MPSHHPVRRSGSLLATIKGNSISGEAAAIQEEAFLARMRRSTERDLGLLELGDVEALTVRGVAAAGHMAGYAVAEIEANPFAAHGVSRVLEAGNTGLERVLRSYIDRS